jgi:ABC-type amino acid transport system permease subunit
MSVSQDSTTSLGLSLTPAFFAAGCCATLPIMVIFGITLAEEALTVYQWFFRGIGVLLLIISLWWYFRRAGLHTVADYKQERVMVMIISIQATLYCILIYLIFTQIFTPFMWYYLVGEMGNCCSI